MGSFEGVYSVKNKNREHFAQPDIGPLTASVITYFYFPLVKLTNVEFLLFAKSQRGLGDKFLELLD